MTGVTTSSTTTRTTRRTTRRASARRTVAVTLAAVAVGVGAAVGAAWALWSSAVNLAGGPVVAGDLWVEIDSEAATWAQVTAGVTDPAGGTLDTPPGVFTVPGEVIELSVPVTTYLRGDNLEGSLEVRFTGPFLGSESGDPSWAAEFRVLDDAGAEVVPAAPLGTEVVVPGLTGDDDGVTQHWTIVVRLADGADPRWVDTLDPATADWPAGTLEVDLRQVRTGVAT